MLPVIVERLEQTFDSDVSIGSIQARFFKRLIINDIKIDDFYQDTLVYCQMLEAEIGKINLDYKSIDLVKIECNGLFFYLKDLDDRGLNFKYFLNKLKKESQNEKKHWKISSRRLNVVNARFNYKASGSIKNPGRMNFKDIYFSSLNIFTDNFRIENGGLEFDIRKMSFVDKSGFEFKEFAARASISKKGIVFDNPYLETENSILIGKRMGLILDSFKDFADNGITERIPLDLDLESSNISFLDIGYFAQLFKTYDQDILFSGKISGPVSNLKGKNLELKIGENSLLECDVYFNGLPNSKITYMHSEIKKLYVGYDDLEKMLIPPLNEKLKLPVVFERIGNFSYTGIFTGFFNDFFTYGTAMTDLGVIKTDISVKPDSSNVVSINGKVECENFEAGKFLKVKDLGSTSFSSNINGRIVPDSGFVAQLLADIEKIGFNDYNYSNIKIETSFRGDNIIGNVEINDPNVNAELSAELYNLKSLPQIKCASEINSANIGKLNFVDSLYQLNFSLNTELTGAEMDDLSGYISVKDLGIIKGIDSLNVGDIEFRMKEVENNFRQLTLISEIADASIEGKFVLSGLIPSYKNIVFNYINSFQDSTMESGFADTNIFEYRVDVKEVQPVLLFLYPGYSVSEKTYVSGKYNPLLNNYHVNVVSPFLIVNDGVFKGITVNTFSSDTALSVDMGCEYFVMNQFRFDHLSVYSDLHSNSMEFIVRWNNWDSLLYKGDLRGMAHFMKEDGHKTSIDLELAPSVFVVHDTIWNLKQSNIRIDSTYIGFDSVKITNRDQFFILNGSISKNPDDTLNIEFDNFRLGNLNLLSDEINTKLGGVLKGNMAISDYYEDRYFISNLVADRFEMNDVQFGTLTSKSSWNSRKKLIEFTVNSSKDDFSPIHLEGNVDPYSKELDATVSVKDFKLDFAEPYLSGFTSGMAGLANGRVKISGTTKAPLLNGSVDVKNAEIDIDYLGTRYSLSDKINIRNNVILFNNITLNDRAGNRARLNGEIIADRLKDFSLNLNIETDNFLFLETNIYDNPDFFGTAFASGQIKITGPTERLKFNILRARTERNTEFFVPLSSNVSASDNSGVEYFPKEKQSDDDLFLMGQFSERKKTSNLEVSIDLEVTPDAKIQLIFDSKIGDIIKGSGSGNMKMEVNSAGDFQMIGLVEVVEGEYLFTLQDVINKRFKIKSGGTIQWDGDPTNAIIDIEAVYSLKTDIAPLFSNIYEDDRGKTTIIPVECQVNLTDNLMNPSTGFDINLPSAGEETKSMVNNLISTEEEKTKQVISLLVTNSFVRPSSNNLILTDAKSFSVVTRELLKNQLSYYLSQWNEDLNVYIDYSSIEDEDAITRQRFEIMLSKPFFNDKLTINSEFDYLQDGSSKESQVYLGDFDLDYRLTDNGKYRLKVFNREHTDLTSYNYDSYFTQGVGFVFRQEYDSFGEYFKKTFGKIFARKEDENQNEEVKPKEKN